MRLDFLAPHGRGPVADKLSQQIADALGRVAAAPEGLPLFAGKAEAGLFPSTAAAKPAAQKCLADGLVRVVAEVNGKAGRERYGLSDAGWEYLLAAVNPKQVLEDFVRVLEARQGEVGELLASARRMADGLHGLREAVARVLPQVTAGRIAGPLPPAPSPAGRGGEEQGETPPPGPLPHRERGSEAEDAGLVWSPLSAAGRGLGGGACCETVPLTDTLLARLADWSAPAGEDCPLPELYRRLSDAAEPPTIGAFHDALRELHAAGAVYLHPWTGPLYALPEPALALLVGHGVAYYASVRH